MISCFALLWPLLGRAVFIAVEVMFVSCHHDIIAFVSSLSRPTATSFRWVGPEASEICDCLWSFKRKRKSAFVVICSRRIISCIAFSDIFVQFMWTQFKQHCRYTTSTSFSLNMQNLITMKSHVIRLVIKIGPLYLASRLITITSHAL